MEGTMTKKKRKIEIIRIDFYRHNVDEKVQAFLKFDYFVTVFAIF